jgi:hypothetical protein
LKNDGRNKRFYNEGDKIFNVYLKGYHKDKNKFEPGIKG